MNVAKAILPSLFLLLAVPARAEGPQAELSVRIPYAVDDLTHQVGRTDGSLELFNLGGRHYGVGADFQLWVKAAPGHYLRPRVGLDVYADENGMGVSSTGADLRSTLGTWSRGLGIDYIYAPSGHGFYAGAGIERRQWLRTYEIHRKQYALTGPFQDRLTLVSDTTTRAEGQASSWMPGVVVGWARHHTTVELAYRSGRVDLPVPTPTPDGQAAFGTSSLRAGTVEFLVGWRF